MSHAIQPARLAVGTRQVSVSTGPLGDQEIRHGLLRRLRVRHRNAAGVALVEELGLCRGQVRVDLVVVNGSLHGYEIKSDRDSLRRLAGQVAVYGRVLDRASLVVGTRHGYTAISSVPDWWEMQLALRQPAGLRLKC